MKDRVIDERTGLREWEAEELLTRAPLFRKPESGPYVKFKNLNSDNDQEGTAKPAIEVGWRWTF